MSRKFSRVITERDERGCVVAYDKYVDDILLKPNERYCGGCDRIQEQSAYSTRGTQCKECCNKKARDSYKKRLEKDPTNIIKSRADTRQKMRDRKKNYIERLGGKCADCSGVFHPCQFDFHHLDPKEKEFNLSVRLSEEAADNELKKCILLCANCHRMRHYGDKNDSTE